MSHLLTTRRPMPSARREHIHGPLLGMERPEGEPSFLAGTALVAAAMLLLTLIAVIV